MAGHSKWANIQHRKGKADKAKAKLFSKLAKEITVAAKTGMADVNTGLKFLDKNTVKPYNSTKSRYEGTTTAAKVIS